MTIHLDRRLAQRLEAADATSTAEYAAAKQTIHPQSASAVAAVGDGVAVFTGLASPIVGVFGLGMTASVQDELLASAETFFAGKGAPSVIHLCPLAEPSLLDAVRRRTYRIASFKQVWMRRLHPVGAAATPHVVVAEATGTQRLLWAKVVSYAYEGISSLEDASTEISLPNAYKPQTRLFIAWMDGAPVGGGALAIHDGVGICYSTSVHPAYRRLGAQTALLAARAQAAHEAGCDIMMVHTVPNSASQRNVERAGFVLAYTRVTMDQ